MDKRKKRLLIWGWWLTQGANKIHSIIYKHLEGLFSNILTKEAFIVQFWRSTNPSDCRWWAEVTLCSTPVSLCSFVFTSFTNSRPWSLIWISMEPCLQMTSYKTSATVRADLSFIGLASYHFEKYSIRTTA